MFAFISILIIIVGILLGLIVLIQDGKSGGLAANFAAQNQHLGVRKTTDTIEKATWTLSAIFVALCLISSVLFPAPKEGTNAEPMVIPSAAQDRPAMPQATPQNTANPMAQ